MDKLAIFIKVEQELFSAVLYRIYMMEARRFQQRFTPFMPRRSVLHHKHFIHKSWCLLPPDFVLVCKHGEMEDKLVSKSVAETDCVSASAPLIICPFPLHLGAPVVIYIHKM